MHTYAFIYLHVVFATWNRVPSLNPKLRLEVHAFIAAAFRARGVSDVYVGGHEDHVHAFGRFPAESSVSSIVGEVKQVTSRWLRAERMRRFRWQRGFSAFSVSRDRIRAVARYVERQEQHHRKRTFRDELETLLAEHGITLEDAHLL